MIAVVIVVAWAGGAAAFARRELSRSESERLAESALRVAPGATHFAVWRQGKHVGYASSTIDTLPARLQVTDYLVADVPAGDTLRRETHHTRVRLTRALELRDYLITRTTDSIPLMIRGRVLSDSTFDHIVRAATGPRGRTLDSARRSMAPRAVPTPLMQVVTMLDGPTRVGRAMRVAALDPVSGLVRDTHVRLAAESLFVVADSAVYDGQAARWRSVHNDTVRAWRLDGSDGSLWVDALGRTVRHERSDGYTLQRTAYELAFENWRSTSPLSNRTRQP